jgi:hypothetical protein
MNGYGIFFVIAVGVGGYFLGRVWSAPARLVGM